MILNNSSISMTIEINLLKVATQQHTKCLVIDKNKQCIIY